VALKWHVNRHVVCHVLTQKNSHVFLLTRRLDCGCFQHLNSPGNKVKAAAEKQPSNLAEKVPTTSHKRPLSNVVNRADAAADMQPSNADEKGPHINYSI